MKEEDKCGWRNNCFPTLITFFWTNLRVKLGCKPFFNLWLWLLLLLGENKFNPFFLLVDLDWTVLQFDNIGNVQLIDKPFFFIWGWNGVKQTFFVNFFICETYITARQMKLKYQHRFLNLTSKSNIPDQQRWNENTELTTSNMNKHLHFYCSYSHI